MTISHERLHAACVRLHTDAENSHRVHGFAAPVLVFVPETGPEDLVLVPEGIPPQHILDAFARRGDAIAILTTGEAWVSVPGLTAQQMAALPPEDLPRPSADPDRAEEITTAVGIGPDGLVTMLRRTRIRRSEHSTVLYEAADLIAGGRDEGAAAVLGAVLAAGNPGLQPRPTVSPARPGPPDLPGTPLVDGLLDDPVCPDCSARIGQLHTDRCCVAWCAALGRQRRDGCDTTRGCRTDPALDCRTTWSGRQPGIDDCRRLGWYAVRTAAGWTSAAPGTPGAVEDLNRLIAQAVWNPGTQRYDSAGDTAPETSALPPGNASSGEAG